MKCEKNGIGFDFGNGHVYPSDMFQCPECKHRILATNKAPSYDGEYKFQEVYLPHKSIAHTDGEDIRETEYWK
jgi:DNA-directed RNA polymerase subunit RPC12/RpoP